MTTQTSAPRDIEAEQAVLAICLLSEEGAIKAASRLEPDSFFRKAHQALFETMLLLIAEGKPTDPVSVANRLEARGALDPTEGRSYLAELVCNTYAALAFAHHVEIVRELAMLAECGPDGDASVLSGFFSRPLGRGVAETMRRLAGAGLDEGRTS
ncbi:DnaB-like helicase N-terminal domain-containing protein [Adlercreutzia sp. ZJ473]|uniref:DnaB-like helicase N-terminal domain-containing protein n=1 Tax=Adlercreutzia sp. ZJ473 TaxID=2722822 RepID=UPI00155446A7|nr:DnaB-like helicase N-terminal domain-containing protein [Adlercreutzia sp. ZJ473]